MLLESLKLCVRIEQRIFVVEAGNVTDIQNAILHSVDPAAAIGLRVGGKAERVCDSSRGITIVRQFPKFLHANAVNLWLASLVEVETLDQLLCQRATWTFAEHGHFRAQIDARLKVWLSLPFLVDTFVARAHADQPRRLRRKANRPQETPGKMLTPASSHFSPSHAVSRFSETM